MTLTPNQLAILAIAAGLYVIIFGLTSKTLISESDIPATKDEKERAKPTPTGRIICVAIGLGSCAYGAYLLLR